MAVKKYDRENRPSPYGVKWTDDGKRKFKFFKNKNVRDDFYKGLVKQEKKLGTSLLTLSAIEASTMRECVEMLGNARTVANACKEYHDKSKMIQIPFEQAIAEYLKEKTLLGRDVNYYRAIKNILDRAQVSLPSALRDWNKTKCSEWVLMLASGYAPITVKNHAKTLNAFCIWCIERKYMQENTFKNAPVPDIIPSEIEFLKVEHVKSLFAAAVEYCPKAVAYLALNTFAGLRSSACARLGIEAIDFKQKGILIQAHQAKNKRRVYLDGHEPNLWHWLEWAKKNAPDGFELTKRQWDDARALLAEKAKPKVQMPHNALRHTFCTYHVALYGDAGKTATLLTHRGNVSILYEHYKGNAANADAKDFFDIVPKK